MLYKYLLTAVTLGLLSTAAQAQQPAGFFESLDLDKNGYLSPAELMDAKQTELLRMDADKDGQVSPAEMPRAAPPSGKVPGPKQESPVNRGLVEHFKAQDADGNGTLSREEFSRGFSGDADHFEKLDRNKDGAVALSELTPKRPPPNSAAPSK